MSDKGGMTFYTIEQLEKDKRLRWDKVIGLKSVKDDADILREIYSPERRSDVSKYQVTGPKGIIFYGPPGLGKTFMAKLFAKHIRFNYLSCPATKMTSPLPGHAVMKIQKMFDVARRNAPCVIFIDEIDAIGKSRTLFTGGADEGILQEILTQTDGDATLKDVLLIAATNVPEQFLDKALLRSGRFDDKFIFAYPSANERGAFFEIYLKPLPCDSIDWELIVAISEDLSFADLKAIIAKASREAFVAKRKIQTNDIIKAIYNLKYDISATKFTNLKLIDVIKQISCVFIANKSGIDSIPYTIYNSQFKYKINAKTVKARYQQIFVGIFGIVSEMLQNYEESGIADMRVESSEELEILSKELEVLARKVAIMFRLSSPIDSNELMGELMNISKEIFYNNKEQIYMMCEEMIKNQILITNVNALEKNEEIKAMLDRAVQKCINRESEDVAISTPITNSITVA